MPPIRPELGAVAATLLAPLYARAADARRPLSLLGDHLAAELVARLDHDAASSVGGATLAPVVRTLVFDDLVRRFLDAHRAGTVIEVGAGLNTRFERLDNGAVRWLDVDLPEVTALRRRLLPSCRRRGHVAAVVGENTSWLELVACAPPPHCFVFEAMLGYLAGPRVRALLARVARRFPGATIAFDLHPAWRIADG